MATFVLIHGSWGGGWIWDLVAPRLTGAGHEVVPVTLAGLEPEGHPAPGTIGLDTHIDDVAGLIAERGLSDVVLVGHSYGGMVITGAAARHPDAVRGLVYVDAFVPEPGQSCIDIFPFLEGIFDALAGPDGEVIPVPDLGELFGLTPEELAWMGDRSRPMPRRTPSDPAPAYPPDLLERKRPTFVFCTKRPDFAPTADAFRARGWPVHVLDTHHYPMISVPDVLAGILLGAAGANGPAQER